MQNRCLILNDRPVGVPGPEFFDIDTRRVPDVVEGEILVRNRYLSVDPAMRGWVNDAPNYSPAVPVGDVMRAIAVGEVVESRHPAYQATGFRERSAGRNTRSATGPTLCENFLIGKHRSRAPSAS